MDHIETDSPIPINAAEPGSFPHSLSLDIEPIATAIVFEGESRVALRELPLTTPGADDVVVDVEWSGVSTGTEKLLFTSKMPAFPGLSYPLVPGYEAVGRIVQCDGDRARVGEQVFVPGARCFEDAAGLFGGAASRLVVPAEKAVRIEFDNPQQATLLALAATAHHAIAVGGAPDLVIGHGVLGRLIVRTVMAMGGAPPNVWELAPERSLANKYVVMDPEFDGRDDYGAICDASGDPNILDEAVPRMRPGGVVTLAGFYTERLSFAFPPAFMKEAQFRIAAEWNAGDLDAVLALIADGKLSLDGLITHEADPRCADDAYRTAFDDPECLKMILDWRRIDGPAI
ncbi:MAG: chlorophyll synthesis pathway protein BchC [Pseudomonadota bacterium]